MNPTRFDALMRSLIQPASRRSALGLIVGTALGLVSEAAPVAAKRRRHHSTSKRRGRSAGTTKCVPKKACDQFCANAFGASTAAGRCKRDAAKRKGLCQTCGASTATLCCPTKRGVCASYETASCCGEGEVCCNGACRRRSALEADCPVGTAGFLTYPNEKMRCAAKNTPACACLGDFRACAPGTSCRMENDTLTCG
jgi:hypothetical protein